MNTEIDRKERGERERGESEREGDGEREQGPDVLSATLP